jgi:hypothetical protein
MYVCICEGCTGINKNRIMVNSVSSKMFKKVTTDLKAAVMLIVTEDVAALRGFFKNFKNSIFKSTPKTQNPRR